MAVYRFEFDAGDWPVVRITARDTGSVEDAEGYIRNWEGDESYGELRPRFPDLPGERAIVDVAVRRVSNSCGFGVPLMEFVGPRKNLADYEGRKGEAGMVSHRERFNARSIDGLAGLEPVGEGSRL